jgi:hypothetical protein
MGQAESSSSGWHPLGLIRGCLVFLDGADAPLETDDAMARFPIARGDLCFGGGDLGRLRWCVLAPIVVRLRQLRVGIIVWGRASFL